MEAMNYNHKGGRLFVAFIIWYFTRYTAMLLMGISVYVLLSCDILEQLLMELLD